MAIKWRECCAPFGYHIWARGAFSPLPLPPPLERSSVRAFERSKAEQPLLGPFFTINKVECAGPMSGPAYFSSRRSNYTSRGLCCSRKIARFRRRGGAAARLAAGGP